MFENTDRTGVSGKGQWGLDRGHHQGGWDPSFGVPASWNGKVRVVMDKFGSELWFEPEPPRTEPKVQFKVLQNGRTEPQVRFRVRQLRPRFEPVQTASAWRMKKWQKTSKIWIFDDMINQ